MFTRREVIKAGGSSVFASGLSGAQAPRAHGVKALTFDVFGTVVDWRTSIIREGELLGQSKRLKVDWAGSRIAGAQATVRRWIVCVRARFPGRRSTASIV